jgi:hypothetical protein
MTMETNAIQGMVGTHCTSVSDVMPGFFPFCHPDPLLQFVFISALAVCIAVVWLAVLNFIALRRADFTPNDAKTVNCRIAISRYVLVFLAAICFLQTVASIRFCAWDVLFCGSGEMNMAQKAILYTNIQPPFFLAAIMVVLVGIHCVIGIIFEVRRKNLKD